jgi:hypothetical protein
VRVFSPSRTTLRFLVPRSPGAPAAGLRRAALAALMPRLLQQSHMLDLLEMLDGGASPGSGADARKVVDALRRRPTTCLYRSLAGFASLRAAGEMVRIVVGVRVERGEVVAHAWLEKDGEPVGEPTDPRPRFAEAFSYPPEGSMASSPSNRDVILTEMKDGSGVLLDLRSKFYFTLNDTGVAVWKLIAAGEAADPRTLAERVARDFATPSVEAVVADVKALLDELEAEGLLGKTD